MNELALFAGAGGGILGGHLLGWRTVCAVEWEPYPASVLCARQNDGLLPPFPIWDDVQTFDGKPWREIVDVVSGGFPCTDISVAGKGAGIDGEASGMWREMARIIHEVQPRFVFVENSPMLTSRGLGRVLGDLAAMGFDARWGVLGAADVGAKHQRDRIWIVGEQMGNSNNNGQITSKISQSITQRSDTISTRQEQTCQSEGSSEQHEELANSNSMRELQPQRGEQNKRGWICNSSNEMANSNVSGCPQSHKTVERQPSKQFDGGSIQPRKDVSNTDIQRLQRRLSDRIFNQERRQEQSFGRITECGVEWKGDRNCDWSAEPNVGRVADGVAARVDRLKAIGNGQVPLCAATAWKLLSERI